MKIGLIGTGNIGRTLARKLAAAGHEVKVANSRGPASIAADVLETGARAATVEEALSGVDVAILSTPHAAFPKIRQLVAALPSQTVVIDTSNYVPFRDGHNPSLDAGQVESEGVRDLFGRPIAKAWNAIFSESFAHRGQPKGHPERIAIPVAADRTRDREIAMTLVEDTGFDAFDAGVLADSWRQQPASPVYCTDRTLEELGPALAAAERDRLPKRRDITLQVIMERVGGGGSPSSEWLVKLGRAIYS